MFKKQKKSYLYSIGKQFLRFFLNFYKISTPFITPSFIRFLGTQAFLIVSAAFKTHTLTQLATVL